MPNFGIESWSDDSGRWVIVVRWGALVNFASGVGELTKKTLVATINRLAADMQQGEVYWVNPEVPHRPINAADFFVADPDGLAEILGETADEQSAVAEMVATLKRAAEGRGVPPRIVVRG